MPEPTATCLICAKQLERDSQEPTIVYDGVQLQTTGAYGSGAYDAIHLATPLLRAVICDPCFRARRGLFWEYVPWPSPPNGNSEDTNEDPGASALLLRKT